MYFSEVKFYSTLGSKLLHWGKINYIGGQILYRVGSNLLHRGKINYIGGQIFYRVGSNILHRGSNFRLT